MKSLKVFLTEVGNSNNPYPYKIVDFELSKDWAESNSRVYARVIFKGSVSYEATLRASIGGHEKHTATINYTANGSTRATNEGLPEAFRVVATLIAGMKEFMMMIYNETGQRIDDVVFEVATTGPMGKQRKEKARQRAKLFTAFIKKQMKPQSVKMISRDIWSVKIPKSFYK